MPEICVANDLAPNSQPSTTTRAYLWKQDNLKQAKHCKRSNMSTISPQTLEEPA